MTIKYETYNALLKMDYNDLLMMFELLFDKKEKKKYIADIFYNTCNNDFLLMKLIEKQKEA